jgi:hypothetical protein
MSSYRNFSKNCPHKTQNNNQFLFVTEVTIQGLERTAIERDFIALSSQIEQLTFVQLSHFFTARKAFEYRCSYY